jgi:hypothetical protein
LIIIFFIVQNFSAPNSEVAMDGVEFYQDLDVIEGLDEVMLTESDFGLLLEDENES